MSPIPWFKVDDSFTFHPKVIALSADAGWLWTRSGAWCAQQLTDGFVPARILPALAATVAHARELVDAGLWMDAVGGWKFHDWEDYQPSKESVEAERAAARDRQRRARAAAKQKRDFDGSNGTTHPSSHGVSHGVTSSEVTEEVTKKCTRESRSPHPFPSLPFNEGASPGDEPHETPKRKSQLPRAWSPTDSHRTRAAELRIDVDAEAEKFRNSALANGRKYDNWNRAFTNWLINGAEKGWATQAVRKPAPLPDDSGFVPFLKQRNAQ